jgi:hypothetical protein
MANRLILLSGSKSYFEQRWEEAQIVVTSLPALSAVNRHQAFASIHVFWFQSLKNIRCRNSKTSGPDAHPEILLCLPWAKWLLLTLCWCITRDNTPASCVLSWTHHEKTRAMAFEWAWHNIHPRRLLWGCSSLQFLLSQTVLFYMNKCLSFNYSSRFFVNS